MTVKIEAEICEKISYMMYHNNMVVVSKIDLYNEGDEVEDLVLKIDSDVHFFRPIERHIDRIAGRSEISITRDYTFKFELLPEFFVNLTENMHSDVRIVLLSGTDVLAESAFKVELLTYDMWPGIGLMPEMIASFVTPNADGLTKIKSRASDILTEWGVDSSFDGYRGDANKVRNVVSALYAAVREWQITYSLPPNDFEQSGQRIRLPEDVLRTRMGTCVDLAVLFASLFESVNLHPIIFFTTGHSFVGVHLFDTEIYQMVGFDSGLYRNEISDNNVCAIECTLAVKSAQESFETASKVGFKNLDDPEKFYCAVEISNARSKIRPLPIRRMENDSWVIEKDDVKLEASVPEYIKPARPIREFEKKLTTVDRWKRDLLDLSARNYLIKMKLGKKFLPLLVPDISLLEKYLNDGRKFTLASKPLEWDGSSEYQTAPFETSKYIGNGQKALSSDIEKGYLHSPQTTSDTESALRSIARNAVQDLEESGYNSLFVQLGSLKWSDPKSRGVANFAPLLLIPVEIRKTMKGFAIEMLDEGPYFNVTLQEKLKQEYGISLPIPDSLEAEDGRLDIDSIIHIVRQAIKKMPSWEVMESAGLGIFSFSQYVIWKDLESNIENYKENPIVRSLIDGTPYPGDRIEFDADPCKSCLVVPADGSQVKAVNASLGHSFVMHGPPGTGKSQTITNIIANAMMNGKTVLFVAEKRAALEVVKKRLDEVGIGNHCLELHSNKTTKKQVVSQLQSVFDAPLQYSDSELSESIEKLRRAKIPLDEYAEELHRPMIAGLSMYDLISRFEDHDVEGVAEIRFQNPVQSFTEEQIENIGSVVNDSAAIFGRIEGIDKETISLIGTDNISLTLEGEVDDCLEDLRSSAEAWNESLEYASSLEMKYSPLDFAKTKEFYKTLMGFDHDLVHDDSKDDYQDRISALNGSIAGIVSELKRCGTLWNEATSENLSDLETHVVDVRQEYGYFIERRYCSEDESVKRLLDSSLILCEGLASLKDELSIIDPVWNCNVFSRSDAKELYSEYKRSKKQGQERKEGKHAEFIQNFSSVMRDSELDIGVYEDTAKIIQNLASQVGDIVLLPGQEFQCKPVFNELKTAFSTAVLEIEEKLKMMISDWCDADPVELNKLKALSTKTKSVFQHFVSRGYLMGCEATGELLDSVISYCDGMIEMGGDLAVINRHWKKSVFLLTDVGSLRSRYEAANNVGFLKKGKARKEFLNSVSSEIVDPKERYEDYSESLKLIEKHASAARILLTISNGKGDCSPVFSEFNFSFDIQIQRLIKEFRRCGELWCKASDADLDELSSLNQDLESEYRYLVSTRYVAEEPAFWNLFRAVASYCKVINVRRGDLAQVDKLWKKEVFAHPDAGRTYLMYEGAILDGDRAEYETRMSFIKRVSASLKKSDMDFDLYEETLGIIEKVADQGRMLYDIAVGDFTCGLVLNDLSHRCGEIEAFCHKTQTTVGDLVGYYDDSHACHEAELDLEQRYVDCQNDHQRLVSLLDLDVSSPSPGTIYEETIKLCDVLEPISDRIHDIASWRSQEKKLDENGLSELIPIVMQGKSLDVLIDTAYRAFFKSCLDYCRNSLERMRVFGPVAFEKSIRTFRKYDKRHTDLNCAILKCHLYQNIPTNNSDVPGTETYTLKKAVQSVRLRKSIRGLLSEIPNALMKACPCFLMSPLSVSQYLSEDFNKFDLVIFDESSQITTTKAICSLGRARNAIVAGDNKQLPPTSFFQKKAETDDDEMIVLDSFLDDCLSLNMSEVYLEWHYRSRHESLIAFSNKMFYGNKMLTFPSSNDREAKVSAVRVLDGVYERGTGRNVVEAKAVVDEIYRRVMDPDSSKQSIGVIAFSTRQQTCIYDLLEDLQERDAVFFDRFNRMPEGVFVKNLETVQGDERDVILFSIGYGRTANGTVYQNFGPLNQAGGWRRLNVAVSRARCEMVVFESMSYIDVKYTPNSGDGVKGIREFLRFAENKGHFEEQDRTVQPRGGSSVLNTIATELLAHGYQCHFSVGSSSFHVDVAVIDPNDPGKYILGILSDGDSYCNSDNTRDREYAREDVLTGLGWNLMHVWSAEWCFNRAKVIEKILKRIEEIEAGKPPAVEAKAGQGDDSDEDEIKPRDREVMTRSMCSSESRSRIYDPMPFIKNPNVSMEYSRTEDVLKLIIDSDGPISETYLIKICGKLKYRRMTDENRNNIQFTLRMKFDPQKNGSFVTYWPTGSDKECDFYRIPNIGSIYTRAIDEISYPELCIAVEDTVMSAESIAEDKLATAVARALNFKRTGANIKDVLNEVIQLNLKNGRLVRTPDGRIMLKKQS